MTPLLRLLCRWFSPRMARVLLTIVYVSMLLSVFACLSSVPVDNIYINLGEY
jgi:hypothetical protein